VVHEAMMSCERGGGRGFEAFQVLLSLDRHLEGEVKVERASWAVVVTVEGCWSEG